ncbi:hypothetical protein FOA52_014626 [Chlamydomonas sp. UWO 241]|nr:hypothetical protein FOA52_014626 [Chlamydomonas sp. UWO 241]
MKPEANGSSFSPASHSQALSASDYQMGQMHAAEQAQPWQKIHALAASERQSMGMGPSMRAPAVGLSAEDKGAQQKAALAWSREAGPNAALSQLLSDVVKAARIGRPKAQQQARGNGGGGFNNNDDGRGSWGGEQCLDGAACGDEAEDYYGGGGGMSRSRQASGRVDLGALGMEGLLLDDDVQPMEAVEALFGHRYW